MAVRQQVVDRYSHMSLRGLADHCQHTIDQPDFVTDILDDLLHNMAKLTAAHGWV